MVKETRIIIQPKDIVCLQVACSSCNREAALPMDANFADFVSNLHCVYCGRTGFQNSYDHLYRLQCALQALAKTLRIEVKEEAT